ncbi:MAG TPA: hypothetical protein VHQ90_00610 [Thermoanaerobaculia bacterium]|nr:hypothetical protein [Thermoanaerobaculia bacterium]
MAGKLTTIQIAPGDIAFLERRGARAHRGGGEFSRSAALQRSLATLRAVLEDCDPLRHGRISATQRDLVVRLLPVPWAMTAFEVEHLGGYLEHARGYAEALRAAGVEAAELAAALAALSFCEKMALVDQAIQEKAPAAAAAEEEFWRKYY